jgi:hypothetical protein
MAWVRWYTRRLPEAVVAPRRAEIASDLWEHRHDATARGTKGVRQDFAVIARMLSGIPADLSWRRGALRSQARPDPGLAMASSRTVAISGQLVVVLAVVGLGIVASTGPVMLAAGFIEGVDAVGVVWCVATLAVAMSLLLGLIRRLNGREHSTVLLVVGSPAPAIAWFWLPPMFLLAVAIAATALLSRAPIQPTGTGVRP